MRFHVFHGVLDLREELQLGDGRSNVLLGLSGDEAQLGLQEGHSGGIDHVGCHRWARLQCRAKTREGHTVEWEAAIRAGPSCVHT